MLVKVKHEMRNAGKLAPRVPLHWYLNLRARSSPWVLKGEDHFINNEWTGWIEAAQKAETIGPSYNDLVIRPLCCLLSAAILLHGQGRGPAQAPLPPAPFDVVEATIAQVHDAMKAGRLTCRELVGDYLKRIEVYDKNGPAINSIVVLNPEVEKQAEELDRRFAQSGLTGPLHCVPVIVKDNFETKGLQTTDGALAFAGYLPEKDAFPVKRIKEAGGLVLAKSNMAEWAFSPYETVNSILPGYTRNPYALNRVTAGSSGGTAAAVAASFGLVGLGSDTGNSIRGPSSHQALVGIRSTMGLTSRAGVMPLSMLADIAGPMTRTVEDAARVFQAIVGEDADDPVTAAAPAHLPQDYLAALDRDGLHGAVIGVLHQAYERPTTDPEIVSVFHTALEDLKRAGATIVDPATVEGIEAIRRPRDVGPCMGFKYDLNHYLAARAGHVPMKDLAEILSRASFIRTIRAAWSRLKRAPRMDPILRLAKQTPLIANRCAMRWSRRWTSSSWMLSSIRHGATHRG